MADFTADTTQLERFRAQIAAAADQLAALESANRDAGRVVVEAARPPRLSGQLAAGMYADATRNGVAFASTARYWTFVHWGAPRRHIAARPFFVEAVKLNTDRVVDVYRAHAIDSLKGVTS